LDEISQCTRKLYLTDGGVYDNLGVDSAYKHCRTLLVSDGGGQKVNEPIPDRDWIRHTIRILDLIDQQGRKQIKDQLLQSYKETIPAKRRLGTYWGIWSDLQNFVKSEASRNAPSQGFLEANFKDSLKLARVQTRLKSIDSSDQEKLINWGYAICDAAMRTHANDMILASHTTPTFPYAGGIA
jgi:NTE family protein